MSRTVHVDGIALWAPRLPGWDAARPILRGEAPVPDVPAARPSPALLPPTERRRAPDTVAIALEVASAACAAAAVDPSTIASVFASMHGDLAISDYMCATLAEAPAMISPTRFHNSVHNAAAGYWTIATGALAPYTALSAFKHTIGAALLEAAVQVDCTGEPVLLVAYDVESRGPLSTVSYSRGVFGVALVLAARSSARTQMTLTWHTARGALPPASTPAAAAVEGNALAPALPLLAALASTAPTTVELSLADDLLLHVAVAPR